MAATNPPSEPQWISTTSSIDEVARCSEKVGSIDRSDFRRISLIETIDKLNDSLVNQSLEPVTYRFSTFCSFRKYAPYYRKVYIIHVTESNSTLNGKQKKKRKQEPTNICFIQENESVGIIKRNMAFEMVESVRAVLTESVQPNEYLIYIMTIPFDANEKMIAITNQGSVLYFEFDKGNKLMVHNKVIRQTILPNEMIDIINIVADVFYQICDTSISNFFDVYHSLNKIIGNILQNNETYLRTSKKALLVTVDDPADTVSVSVKRKSEPKETEPKKKSRII